MPINLMISKLLRLGPQTVTIQAGIRYWADSPDSSPDDWGARLAFTLLYPKLLLRHAVLRASLKGERS